MAEIKQVATLSFVQTDTMGEYGKTVGVHFSDSVIVRTTPKIGLNNRPEIKVSSRPYINSVGESG